MKNTPKLRFPEFLDDGEWEEKKVEEIFDFCSTANNSRADLSDNGDTFYIHYGDIHTKFHTYINFSKDSIPKISSNLYRSAALLKNGDLIIADASEDTEGIGKAVEVCGLKNDIKAISGLHTILLRDTKKEYVDGFRGLLREINFVKNQLKRLAVGSKVYSVSKKVLNQILLPVPKHAEQQKIADCLSSVDNLITAQSKKVQTLKEHKKALMQQLFPQDGEEVPKLRFPEFKNAPKWEEKKLGSKEVCNSISSGKDKNDSIGKFDLYGSTGIIGKSLNDSYDGNFILVARVGANAGFLTKANGKFGVTDNTLVIDLNKEINADFIFSSLERFGLNKLIFGSGQPLITGGQLKAISIFLPNPKEQQKIANFLSSIDELITSSTKKVETLKKHKKALMQQLFPSKENEIIIKLNIKKGDSI